MLASNRMGKLRENNNNLTFFVDSDHTVCLESTVGHSRRDQDRWHLKNASVLLAVSSIVSLLTQNFKLSIESLALWSVQFLDNRQSTEKNVGGRRSRALSFVIVSQKMRVG